MTECSDFAIEYICFLALLKNDFFENAYCGESPGLVLNAPVISLFLVSREIVIERYCLVCEESPLHKGI